MSFKNEIDTSLQIQCNQIRLRSCSSRRLAAWRQALPLIFIFLQGLHMGLIIMPLRISIMIFGKTNDYDEIHNVCTYTFTTENDGRSVIRHILYILCHIPIELHVILSIIMSVSCQKISWSLEIYMILKNE